MRQLLRQTTLCLALLFGAAPSFAAAPLPAPLTYVSPNYALTFQTPAEATYCPLPEGWVGSDHGTIIFLAAPKECGGTGFPSISRGFAPEFTPRIEVYYGYWDDGFPVPACDQIGRAQIMGHLQPLCRITRGEMVGAEVSGMFDAGAPAQAIITLVTTSDRLNKDIDVLKTILKSVHTCVVEGDGQNGSSSKFGTGEPCPANGGWF